MRGEYNLLYTFFHFFREKILKPLKFRKESVYPTERSGRIGATGSFHMIVSIASKARDAGWSAMSLGQTIEFLRVFWKQAT